MCLVVDPRLFEEGKSNKKQLENRALDDWVAGKLWANAVCCLFTGGHFCVALQVRSHFGVQLFC